MVIYTDANTQHENEQERKLLVYEEIFIYLSLMTELIIVMMMMVMVVVVYLVGKSCRLTHDS